MGRCKQVHCQGCLCRTLARRAFDCCPFQMSQATIKETSYYIFNRAGEQGGRERGREREREGGREGGIPDWYI